MEPSVARLAAGGSILLMLAACQAPPGPGQNFAALQSLPTSRACVASLPPFGYWQYSRERFDSYYVPPNASILVGDDGGWCQIRFEHWWGNQPIQAPLAVTTPPQHGEAMVGSVGTSLRIAYKPVPGFSGTDAFTVHLTAPQPWDIPVRVNVVR